MSLLSLFVLALIGETIWETLKLIWQEGKLNIDRIGAIAVGLLLTFGTGLDMMELVGIPMHIPFVGTLLTALIISRGANFVHDLLASINNLQLSTKPASKNIGINPGGNIEDSNQRQ